MKLSLLFVAIIGVATVSAVPTSRGTSLQDDFNDFKALIDTEALLEVAIKYLAEDEEVQAAVQYVLSDDFKALIVATENIPEYIRFLNYLQSAGLNVYKWVNRLHGFLGLDELTVPKSLSGSRLVSTRNTGGLAGLWAEVKALLPMKELRALHEKKLKTSDAYADLVGLLTSPEARKIYAELKANEEYQHIRETLSEHGVDVNKFFEVLKDLIGWTA